MAADRIAVVGGGLAGLSAAVELRRLGFDVDLFERSRQLGGKATSYVIDGIEVDGGQHVFLGCCSEFIDFVAGLGLSDQLYLQDRFEVVMLKRGAGPCRLQAGRLPAPFHLLPALVAHRHLGWAGRLQVAWALSQAREPARPGETFATWLRRHGQGARARRCFWDPFIVPALNASAEDVSAEAALFVIATAFASHARAACIGFASVPLARLAEAAGAQAGTVHLQAHVTSLRTCEGRVRSLHVADGREVPVDGLVLAVTPRQLGRLLVEPGRFGLDGLDAIRSAPIVDVHLWYDHAEVEFSFAAILDSPVQWVFQKAPGYLCCSLSAARAFVARPVAELTALCDAELRAVVPALGSARLLRSAATRDPEATFVPSPGLRRPSQATSYSNLAIAGAWTDTGWPATMESAVRSGRAAARLLAEGGGRCAA